jgi:hypothetical protein
MSVAFDRVCRALGVSYTANGAREAIATKIIELARRGECDPDRLRDRVITEAAKATFRHSLGFKPALCALNRRAKPPGGNTMMSALVRS